MEVSYKNGVVERVVYTELPDEKWMDIPECDGYQVSNMGRARCCRDNRGKLTDTYRIIKPSIDKDGYYRIDVSKFNEFPRKQYHKRLNCLVCELFNGPSLEPGMIVDHKDDNKWNNKASNLQWVTPAHNSTLASKSGLYKTKLVRIKETGEIFNSIKECADALNVSPSNISVHINNPHTHPIVRGVHIECLLDDSDNNSSSKGTNFLYPHQNKAIKKMFSGCILNGGTGSGKSRTALYWYFSKNGGYIGNKEYKPMKPNPPDLYIITTAKKRSDLEWEEELIPFHLFPDKETKLTEYYENKVVIDSWQCIKKYQDVRDAVFIFDEDKLTGKGAWCKAFLKISEHNEWIILSASPGDVWQDYETVFVANGFFRNRTEFRQEHLIYSRWTKYPSIEGYKNETRLIRLRDRILIDMDFDRHTIPHDIDVLTKYDVSEYKQAIRTRFDPFKEEPIQQASGLCYVLRRIVNSDESRQVRLLEIFEKHPRMIVFYSFNYELDILKNLAYGDDVVIAEYNGSAHDAVPTSKRWVYLVQYTAGCEGWNNITTNCIVFYSQTYSYKTLLQAKGRIDRLNTPFTDLYYYHLKSKSGIDLAISRALHEKRKFNERKWCKWD